MTSALVPRVCDAPGLSPEVCCPAFLRAEPCCPGLGDAGGDAGLGVLKVPGCNVAALFCRQKVAGAGWPPEGDR